VRPGRIMSMKNSNDTIGNRTRDLPVCSAVLQPTAPPLAATATGSSKQAWHIPDAVRTVFELLMMGAETARNMYSIDNNKEYCISLRLVGCT